MHLNNCFLKWTLFAFQHHPQIIAIFIHPLLLMHYHVYLLDISANRGEKHAVSSPSQRKEMFSLFKSAVIIRLSAFLILCSQVCPCASDEWSEARGTSVKDLLQNNSSNNIHSKKRRNEHYANLKYLNCLCLLHYLLLKENSAGVIFLLSSCHCIHRGKYFYFYRTMIGKKKYIVCKCKAFVRGT